MNNPLYQSCGCLQVSLSPLLTRGANSVQAASTQTASSSLHSKDRMQDKMPARSGAPDILPPSTPVCKSGSIANLLVNVFRFIFLQRDTSMSQKTNLAPAPWHASRSSFGVCQPQRVLMLSNQCRMNPTNLHLEKRTCDTNRNALENMEIVGFVLVEAGFQLESIALVFRRHEFVVIISSKRVLQRK